MALLKLFVAALALAAPVSAWAECKIRAAINLPVTMEGRFPMISAKFGDKDARFILDSGAFYSTLSRASATEFGLTIEPAPPGFYLTGIGGNTSASVVVTRTFSLAGLPFPKVDFVVGGSDMGTAGLIGQNILGLVDIEYDLAHGAVHLIRTSGCADANMAYWAGDKPVTVLPLIVPETRFKPHTIASVLINGVKVRALFDTGASRSLLSLAAAKRIGITPNSPGVESIGASSGLGTRTVPTWLTTFDRIEIGGEAIKRPKIRIAEMDITDADMLIGVDFFLTHRIYVSNTQRKMFVTYEGGPVFGLSPKGVYSADGKPLDLTDKAPEPKTAEEFSRRGAALATNRRLADALADFDRAIALAPGEGRYFYQRAMAHFANEHSDLAMADLDRTIALAPTLAEARLTRAAVRLRAGNRSGAAEDIDAANALVAPSSDMRLDLVGMYDGIDRPADALANANLWLKSHPEDSSRPRALNGRCWALGQLNQELDKALSDCNAAVKARPAEAAYLDSRALVRLRRGELAKARADYDAALAIEPRIAWSRYMRGIVAKRMGDTATATQDRAAALALDATVSERAHRIGIDD